MWTRGKKRERQIALGIGIALTAGMIGAPTAFGAPVLDTSKGNGGVVIGDAKVEQTIQNAAQGLKNTNITSSSTNNVLAWKDFSNKSGETIQFDKNNYMNIVTGDNTSTIDGNVKGTGDIYLVNPNGVIFGKTAQVSVGNLYVSTRNINPDKISGVTAATGDLSSLVNTNVSALAADVVNLGTVQATSVHVEAGNVRFLDAADVTSDGSAALSDKVSIRSGGEIHVGYRGEYRDNYNANYTVNNLQGGTSSAEYYNVVDSNDWKKKIEAKATGKFMLDGDIDAKNQGGITTPFSGKLDGMGNAFQNVAFERGLFAETNGATVENVGIASGTISGARQSDSGDVGGGSFVGNATDTTLKNVYNLVNVSSGNSDETGGIVGFASGTTIDNAYNAGTVDGGAFIGNIVSSPQATTIQNSFSTGKTTGDDLVSYGDETSTVIKNVYANAQALGKTATQQGKYSNILLVSDGAPKLYYNSTVNSMVSYPGEIPSALKKSTYTSLQGPQWDSISSTGAVTRKEDGSTSRATWRIYENQSEPMLTSLMKGVKTISYDYTQGGAKGSNNGGDLTLTYNAGDVAFSNIDYGSADASLIHTGKTTLHDANVVNSDTVNTVGTAYFYSDPLGYDLVGGNVTVKQREVTIKSDLPMKAYAREYDGTADASGAINAMFAGDGTSAEGIIAGDATVSLDTTQATAKFAKSEGGIWKDDADVGANKTILLNGKVTLKNAPGHNNYFLSSDSTSFNNRTFTDAGNKITQKALYVDFAAGKGTDINREYDGVKNTAVADAYLPTKDTFALSDPIKRKVAGSDGQVTEQAEDVSLVYDRAANYVDAQDTATGKAGDYTNHVKYAGLKLTGAQAKNYYLVYGSKDNAKGTLYQEAYNGVGQDVNKDAGGAIYGSGKITKKNLTNQDYFWMKGGAFQDAVREYTGTPTYQDPVRQYVSKKGSAGLVARDDLHFVVTGADFVDGQGSDTTTKDVGTAKAVKYAIRVEGADAENYTLNGKDIQAKGAASLWGEGTLTPRTINLSVDPAKKAAKTYDASDDVKSTDGTRTALNWDDGFLKYAIDDNEHKLVKGDTDKIVYTGKYQKTGNDAEAKDVNYDAAGQTLDKDVAYTVKILHADGTDSTNYRIVEGTGTSTANATELTMTGKGAGRIDPKKLTDVKFASVSKKFDASAALGNYADYTADSTTYHDSAEYAVKNGTASGLYGTETLEDVIDAAKLEGVYGEGATAAGFAANEHVHRKDAPTEKAHDMMYRGKNGADFLTALKNHNYTIGADSFAAGGTLDGGAYIEAKAGTIDPTTVDTITIGLKDKITKVYDGTTKILAGGNEVADYRSLLTDLSAKLPNGKSIDLSYTVVTDGDKTPVYDSKNVLANGTKDRNITFYLKVDESGDIALSKSLHAAATEAEEQALGYNLKTDSSTFHGTITPRELQVKASDKTADRAYDRTDKVRAGGRTDLTLDDGYVTYRNADDAAHHLVQGEKDALVIHGTYQMTNSEWAGKDVSYDAKGDPAQKDITYAFSFKDEDAKNNYTIAPTTVAGKGTITPLGLTINVNPMTKTYDGTNALSDANKASITLTNPELKGLAAQDAVALKTDRLKEATYGSESAGETNVTYQLELDGDDKGNFYIQKSAGDADDLVKNGTGANATYTLTTKNNYISPLALKDDDIWFDFQGITKVYDGSTDVDYDHTGWAFEQEGKKTAQDFVRHLTIGSKANDLVDHTGAFQKSGSFSSRAFYADANAGTKNVQYFFTLDKAAAGNYVWKDVTFHTTGADGSVTLTKDAQGKITPQNVVASVTKEMDKVYNGTEDVVTGSGQGSWADAQGTSLGMADYNGVLSLSTADKNGLSIGRANFGSGTAKYQASASFGAADVAYDAQGDPAKKDIRYTVNLTGADASNYKFFTSAADARNDANGQVGVITATGQGTISPKEITELSFAHVEKEFDGTPDATPENLQAAVNGATSKDFDGANAGAKYVSAQSGQYDSLHVRLDDKGNPTDQDMTYTGIAVTNRNFRLALPAGTSIKQEKGGKITKADATITVNYVDPTTPVSKVYDGNTDVGYDHSTWGFGQNDKKDAIDFVSDIVLTPTNAKLASRSFGKNADFFLKNTNAMYQGVDAGPVKADLRFTFGEDATQWMNDFNFTNLSADLSYTPATGVLHALANGTIEKQKVVAGVKNDAAHEKTYDGGNQLVNADGMNIPMTDLLRDLQVRKASDPNNWKSADDREIALRSAVYAASQDGKYTDSDVSYDASGSVTNKDILYTAELYGDAAKNYELYSDPNAVTGAGASSVTLTGSNAENKILPYHLANIDFGFDDSISLADYNKPGDTSANKTYDGTTDVKKIETIAINGQNGETVKLRADHVTGTYGTWKAGAGSDTAFTDASFTKAVGTFTPNANVNYDAKASGDEKAKTGYKAVKYTIDAEALKDPESSSGGFKAGNYTIADTVIFSEEAQKGKIRRLALTGKDIEHHWEPGITKEYDATDALPEDLHSLLTLNPKGYKDVKLQYTGTGAYDDAAGNVGKGIGITAKGIQIDPVEANNFTIDLTTMTPQTYTTTGDITPRLIDPYVLHATDDDYIAKVYDGTTDVARQDNIGLDVMDVTSLGWTQETDTDGTVYYKDKNGVTVKWDASYASENATGSKGQTSPDPYTDVITYALTLAGNEKGNYTFDPNLMSEKTSEKVNGAIWKRKVFYDFYNPVTKEYGGQLTGIEKPYDGNASVLDLDALRNRVELLPTDKETGIVDNVTLARDGILVSYDDENVFRKDGIVVPNGKEVKFSNIALTDNKNYDLVAADSAVQYADNGGLVGLGTITPKTLHVSTDGKYSKVYDGTNTVYDGDQVDSSHKNNDGRKVLDEKNFTGIKLTDADLVTRQDGSKDQVHITLQKAEYDAPDAGTNKISYALEWDNGNYDLALDARSKDTIELAGQTATLKGNNGEITKRALTVKPLNAEKIYNGDTALSDPVRFLTPENTVNGKDPGLFATGTYDDPDAANAVGDPEKDHVVTYTFGVSNPNYELAGGIDSAKGNGVIHRRDVFVDFLNGAQASVTPKVYNGSNDSGVNALDYLAASGFVPGEAANRSAYLADAVAMYADGNVARDASGAVIGKEVFFTGMRLGGDKAKNYTLKVSPNAAGKDYGSQAGDDITLIGSGRIDPKELSIHTTGTNTKAYDGTTDVFAGDGRNLSQLSGALSPISGANVDWDASGVLTGDAVHVSLIRADYEGASRNSGANAGKAGDKLGIHYQLAWDNRNYTFAHVPAGASDLDSVGTVTVSGSGLAADFIGHNGQITRRALGAQAQGSPTKEYDGSSSVGNAGQYITYTNLAPVDAGKAQDAWRSLVTGDYVVRGTRTATADAADSDVEASTPRDVWYRFGAFEDENYALDPAVLSDGVTGSGQITRRALSVTANPASAYMGDPLPAFSLGSVSGQVPGEDFTSDFVAGLKDPVTGAMATAAPAVPGRYAVYGWYGGRSDGNFGRNYTFSQDPANETAFELKVLDPGHEYHDAIESNRVIPDDTVYHQASGDYTEAFIRDPKYAIEYAAGGVGSGAESVSQGAGRQGSALVTTAAEEARNASDASAPAGGTGAGRAADALVTTAEKDAAGSGATGTAGAIGAAGNGATSANGTAGTVAGGASLYGGGQAALFGSGGSSMPQYFGYGPTGSMMGASSLLGAYGSMTLAQSGMESLSSLVSGAGTGSLTGADLSTVATSGAPSPYGLDAALGLFAGGSSPQYFALGAPSTAGAAGTSSGLTGTNGQAGADGQASGGAPATAADTAAATGADGADASAAEGQTASRLARIGLDGQDAVNLTDGDAMDGEEVLTMVEKKQAKDA